MKCRSIFRCLYCCIQIRFHTRYIRVSKCILIMGEHGWFWYGSRGIRLQDHLSPWKRSSNSIDEVTQFLAIFFHRCIQIRFHTRLFLGFLCILYANWIVWLFCGMIASQISIESVFAWGASFKESRVTKLRNQDAGGGGAERGMVQIGIDSANFVIDLVDTRFIKENLCLLFNYKNSQRDAEVLQFYHS